MGAEGILTSPTEQVELLFAVHIKGGLASFAVDLPYTRRETRKMVNYLKYGNNNIDLP